MPEAKDDLKREKVRIVPISNIEDFPDHIERESGGAYKAVKYAITLGKEVVNLA